MTASPPRAAADEHRPTAELASRCPLCSGTRHTDLDSFPYAEIWDRLYRDWGVRFSDDVIDENTPAAQTNLVRCDRCGLEFFSPLRPGTERYYQELMRGIPYARSRWEFEFVASRLVAGDSVLDLGCGAGHFLQRVERHAGRTVGVDLNPDVTAELTGTGVEIHNKPFEDFAAAESRSFDLVSAFQVAEHIADVSTLLEPAAACLRPSGRLFLSVPNPRRWGTQRLEPLDCPPHHVSRWQPPQLLWLAHQFDLRLRNIYFEPPFFGITVIREHLYSRRLPRVAFETKWYGRWGLVGHSLLGEFERASA